MAEAWERVFGILKSTAAQPANSDSNRSVDEDNGGSCQHQPCEQYVSYLVLKKIMEAFYGNIPHLESIRLYSIPMNTFKFHTNVPQMYAAVAWLFLL